MSESSEATAFSTVIADPDWIARFGLRSILERGGFRVAGEAESGEQAAETAGRLQPALVVLAGQFPGENGAKVCRGVAQAAPGSRILVLSGLEDVRASLELFAAGASGVLERNAEPEKLLSVARAVSQGEYRVPDPVMRVVAAGGFRAGPFHGQGEILSPAEREVVTLFVSGMSYAAIGKRYGRSRNAIANRMDRIRRKLGVRTTQELAIWAYRNWLVH